jgi:3-hydroxyisobutyrate dehydrogenase-like beta-hydroxyacid dehydrogenase
MAFVVDERTGNAQIDAAAGVYVDAPVAGHHAVARQTELRMLCLIAKAAFHGVYRLFNRNKSFELFRFE